MKLDRSRVLNAASACLVVSGLIIGGAGGALALADPGDSGDQQSSDTSGDVKDRQDPATKDPQDPVTKDRQDPVTKDRQDPVTKDRQDPVTKDRPRSGDQRSPRSVDQARRSVDQARRSVDQARRSVDQARRTVDQTRRTADRNTLPRFAPLPRATRRTFATGWRWGWWRRRGAERSPGPATDHAASAAARRSGAWDTRPTARHRRGAGRGGGRRGASARGRDGVCRRDTARGRCSGTAHTHHLAGGRGPIDRARGSRSTGRADKADAAWGAAARHHGSVRRTRTATGQYRQQRCRPGVVPRRIRRILASRRTVAAGGLGGARGRGHPGTHRCGGVRGIPPGQGRTYRSHRWCRSVYGLEQVPASAGAGIV